MSDKIGGIIRDLRKHLGLTQQELATQCGLSKSAIGLIENGSRKPSVDALESIALSLNIKTSSLMLLAESSAIKSDLDKKLLSARNRVFFEAVSQLQSPEQNRVYERSPW